MHQAEVFYFILQITVGAFGRVCRARRLVDGVDVVVKEVRTVALSGKLRLAMLDEVSVLASLSHPNVVQYIDAFIDDMCGQFATAHLSLSLPKHVCAQMCGQAHVIIDTPTNTNSLSLNFEIHHMGEISRVESDLTIALNRMSGPDSHWDCLGAGARRYINTVMEFCSAGDLGQLLKARAGVVLSEGTAMFLFVQICLAIHYVHAAGITHRDLKAGNCMLFDGAASWHAGHNDVTAAAAAAAAGCAVGISVCAADYAGLPLLKLGDFGVAKARARVDAISLLARDAHTMCMPHMRPHA
jgi:serine/threonine protein kinase